MLNIFDSEWLKKQSNAAHTCNVLLQKGFTVEMEIVTAVPAQPLLHVDHRPLLHRLGPLLGATTISGLIITILNFKDRRSSTTRSARMLLSLSACSLITKS